LGALRELVRNAIMHRTYEGTNAPTRVDWFNDRIEIMNPGAPFGLASRGNFGEPGVTDYRNPNLAEAMRVLGFVQRFGVGIATARKLLRENGHPDLEFRIDPTHVRAIVRPRG
jgi:ATP-dependent DNA helicase RecG